ncbi:CLUMA_CG000725, isoform A [Clunio marinus]|uniref:CLUMA_CG000725, isoform A n=1 Tax=Clunio marinus TaxID=568069 RepID=A0A1J1HFZ5_9DIPT|nr:CLUMA_CG000725, isoform A [Clunio marinus]
MFLREIKLFFTNPEFSFLLRQMMMQMICLIKIKIKNACCFVSLAFKVEPYKQSKSPSECIVHSKSQTEPQELQVDTLLIVKLLMKEVHMVLSITIANESLKCVVFDKICKSIALHAHQIHPCPNAVNPPKPCPKTIPLNRRTLEDNKLSPMKKYQSKD